MTALGVTQSLCQLPAALLHVVVVWLWTLSALCLGRFFTLKSSSAGLSLLPGLALLAVPALLANMALGLPLYVFPAIGLVVAASLLVIRKGLLQTLFLENAAFLNALLFMTPLMVFAAQSVITGWDDVSHWNPNMDYLVRYHALPRADGPPTASAWPGYPYAYPFFGYLVNLVAPGYAANALPLLNVVFLSLAASMAAHVAFGENPRMGKALAAAAGLLLVIPLYPGYHRSTTFVALADYPTAVWLAGTVFLLMHYVSSKAYHNSPPLEGERIFYLTSTQDDFLHVVGLTLCFLALVSIKQANLVLIIALTGVLALFLLSHRAHISPKRVAYVMAMGLAAAALHAVWSHYVKVHIGGVEFALLPFDEWRFALIPDILKGMWDNAVAKHGHYYVMLIATAIFGSHAYFKTWRNENSQPDLFVITAAFIVLAYFAFLLFIYIANSFSLDEAKRAASFWRYGLHVGLLGWLAFLFLARGWITRRFPKLSLYAPRKRISIVLCLVIAVSPVAMPRTFVRETNLEERLFFRRLAETLPENATVAIYDAHPGSPMPWVLSLELRSPAHAITGKVIFDCFKGEHPKSANEAFAFATACNATHAVLRPTWPIDVNAPEAGFELFERASNGTWRPFKNR